MQLNSSVTPPTAPRPLNGGGDAIPTPSTAVKQLFDDEKTSNPRATRLWGCWELWCDFPAQLSSATQRRAPTKASTSDVGAILSWLDTVKSVGVFDTAEGFWALHGCIQDISTLPAGINFYLLRRNIPPMWEHEANRRGGKWTAHFTAAQSKEADALWLYVRLMAIGENFPCGDEDICGVTASRRRNGFRVSVWLRYSDNEGVRNAIGGILREQLGTTDGILLKFTDHWASLEAAHATAARARSPLTPMEDFRSRSLSPVGSPTMPPDGFSPPVTPASTKVGINV
jgi:translation initiation factor 4E